jgi:hypothetical protein
VTRREGRSMRLMAIPAIVIAGALVSRLTLLHHPAELTPDLAQPIPVVTAWGGYGLLFWTLLAATVALMHVPYVRAFRDPPALVTTAATTIACGLGGLAWLPLFSSDVYAYAAYGEMARLGIDPYQHHALSPQNPVFAAAVWQWTSHGQHGLPICLYGPLFVTLARLVVSLPHSGVLAQLEPFRGGSVISLFVSALLAYAVAPGDVVAKRRAALTIGCNPIALWAAIEGHNDTMVPAIVLAGFALMRYQVALAAALATCAALVKLPALAAGAGAALHAAVTRRERLRTIGGFVAGVVVVALTSRSLFAGIREGLVPHAHYAPLASVQALGIPVAAIAGCIVIARTAVFRLGLDRWGLVALAAWLAIPNPYPWYALWILPFAAFARDARLRTAVFTVSAAAMLRYLPDAAGPPSPSASIAMGLVALLAYAPLMRRAIITRS